ncbi:MAG: hypothetical protein H6742_14585 [Alphaproteobacteria bacterium]|nr:hypothetical protein [Alphaproteobacteria bacterium]
MLLPLLLLAACTGDGPAGPGDTGAPGTACNGRDEWCAWTLAQVTLPGTHNSMSNADDGWWYPNQQHGIARQLDDGVRALMLDTHEWEDELWLCHGYCELGRTPLADGLAELQDFLDAHPREVVLIIFEDHVAAPDMVAALQASGLGDRAIVPPGPGEDWPTLGELVDADRRVLLTAEGGGAGEEEVGVDWYLGAWDVFFDTPYSFASEEEFSCERNRGDEGAPLFLVNHWISDPLPSEEAAAVVNRAEVLGARAAACAARWDRPITFLGVDFYATGDLFGVTEALMDGADPTLSAARAGD